ncbi:MAG: D-alanine--D-alanine ligase B [Gemmatimonadaceae bacterium]|nr:D-alanine--D-alanine ligase B [Gemmatimonadaceae bacterium]
MKIAVLMGGTSAERDVSLASGVRVAEALRLRGHEVILIDTVVGRLGPTEEAALLAGGVLKSVPPDVHTLARLDRQLPTEVSALPDVDAVFLALHGGRGEDGTVQALLDLAGVPYTGSGHLASALAMDKDLSKRLFRQAGVPTPEWMMSPVTARAVEGVFGFPCVVKPSKQGSTVGLTLVRGANELPAALEHAREYDDEVMVEQFIPGRELTVGILGERALPVGEIIPVHEIYDYECKYTPGMAREVFPAALAGDESSRVQALAVRAFVALKLRGYARIDFRMSPSGEFFCLEANTLPGMTELSLIPQAAAAAQISFPDLCERIVELALP